MVLDKNLIFDSAATLTTSKMSENTINLGVVRDIAKGSPIYFNVLVNTAFNVGTLTCDIVLCNSSATPTSSDATKAKWQFSIAATELGKKGYLFRAAIPEGLLSQKYVNVSYVATTALATGKISTFLTIG